LSDLKADSPNDGAASRPWSPRRWRKSAAPSGFSPTHGPTNQNWLKSWAQTATMPTNSVIDAKAAASSTKIRNIVTSFGLEHTENNVPFLF
jgi:hypothetical protein